VGLVLALRQDWRWLGPALRQRRTLAIYTLAAALLSVNWFTYIWGVNAGFIVETSLGYFINPLVSMLLGVLFLGERLRRGQVVAVGLAALGVLYLTFDYGRLPWIALVLALTFGLYGLIKKTAPRLAARHSLEIYAMFPALAYLLFLQFRVAASSARPFVTAMLVMAVTSIPLLLFGVAARRIPLSMIGFLQYIAPTLQFLLGVLVYKEPFPPARLLGFIIIWAALVVYSFEGLWFNRRK
jgi:chloramphenicol-sensitive protein RarD